LGASAGFSQISIVPGQGVVASPGSFFGGMVKIGCLYSSILLPTVPYLVDCLKFNPSVAFSWSKKKAVK
jgi:hypothetical protein